MTRSATLHVVAQLEAEPTPTQLTRLRARLRGWLSLTRPVVISRRASIEVLADRHTEGGLQPQEVIAIETAFADSGIRLDGSVECAVMTQPAVQHG